MKALGHPDHTYVLIYPGGYGGEFLCHWLGQHSGCVPVPTTVLPNNRYTINFDQIRIHPRAETSKLFLPGHNMHTYAAKNKFIPGDISCVIGVHASLPFQKFYFVLFAAKTILYRYGPQVPMPSVDAEKMAQFLNSIYPQTEFYHHEFDAWQNNQSAMSIDQIIEQRFRQGCVSANVDTAEFNINLDQLFFGNFVDREIEYQRLCDHIDTVPNAAMLHQLDQYCDKNLDLVSSITRMPVLDFVALSNDQAWPVILESCQRLV